MDWRETHDACPSRWRGRREYVYGAESKIGTFGDTLMAVANKKGWIVVSMKDD